MLGLLLGVFGLQAVEAFVLAAHVLGDLFDAFAQVCELLGGDGGGVFALERSANPAQQTGDRPLADFAEFQRGFFGNGEQVAR